MIADERKKRLTDAMKDAGLDALLVYGNAWQGDYLRYTTNFSKRGRERQIHGRSNLRLRQCYSS